MKLLIVSTLLCLSAFRCMVPKGHAPKEKITLHESPLPLRFKHTEGGKHG